MYFAIRIGIWLTIHLFILFFFDSQMKGSWIDPIVNFKFADLWVNETCI